LEPKVVEERHRGDRVGEVVTAASMVAEYAPVFEPCDRMLDARAASAMATPGTVPHDSVAAEAGCGQLGDAAVSAVGEHPAVAATQGFDGGATVVDRVVAIPGPPAATATT
jgi:hypothetical protein